MKPTVLRSALLGAVLVVSFGVSACHDGHPDRDDRRHGEHRNDGGRDGDHHEGPHG